MARRRTFRGRRERRGKIIDKIKMAIVVPEIAYNHPAMVLVAAPKKQRVMPMITPPP